MNVHVSLQSICKLTAYMLPRVKWLTLRELDSSAAVSSTIAASWEYLDLCRMLPRLTYATSLCWLQTHDTLNEAVKYTGVKIYKAKDHNSSRMQT